MKGVACTSVSPCDGSGQGSGPSGHPWVEPLAVKDTTLAPSSTVTTESLHASSHGPVMYVPGAGKSPSRGPAALLRQAANVAAMAASSRVRPSPFAPWSVTTKTSALAAVASAARHRRSMGIRMSTGAPTATGRPTPMDWRERSCQNKRKK